MIQRFGLIALLVLLVSVSSAFVESAYADEHEPPIKIILDLTHENILDSIDIAVTNGDLEPDEAADLIQSVNDEYDATIILINGDDVVAAKESVIQTMSSFEVIAVGINALENQASTLLPPGFGAGFDSASDTGITQGQGLGVGGIPLGILGVVEEIAYSENEAGEYRELVKVNNLDGIDFGDFDEKVNLAKTLLAEGLVPDAQVQLILANQIKEQIYEKIDAAGDVNAIEGIEALLEDQKNLGLTKKVIREFEEVLEDLDTGDSYSPEESGDDSPGNSGDAPGQEDRDSPPGNSGDAPGQEDRDSPPGNSGDAPGQNKDNEEGELPPGFEAAVDSASDEGIANGQGLGIGNIPPGQLKKLGYSFGYDQSYDDYYENHYEGSVDDDFEESYDGTNKGHGDGKGKLGAHPGKSGEAPGKIKSRIHEDKGGQNANFGNCGIPGNNPNQGPEVALIGSDTINLDLNDPYVEQGATVCDNIDDDTLTAVITGAVDTANVGTYVVTYTATDSNGNITVVTRTVNVTNGDVPVITFTFGVTDDANRVCIDVQGGGQMDEAAITILLTPTYTDTEDGVLASDGGFPTGLSFAAIAILNNNDKFEKDYQTTDSDTNTTTVTVYGIARNNCPP